MCSKRKRKRAKDRRIAGIGISQKPFQLPHTPISISAVSIPLIPNVHFMLCLLSLTGKLVLKHVYLLPHALFSIPNLKMMMFYSAKEASLGNHRHVAVATQITHKGNVILTT